MDTISCEAVSTWENTGAEKRRKKAAIGIVLLLVAFIPAHVHFIQSGGCFEESLCVPLWVAWLRVFPVHPLLMAWAWCCR